MNNVYSMFITALFAFGVLCTAVSGQEQTRAQQTEAKSLVREAERALENGNYDQAAAALEELQELLPHSPEVSYNQGVAAFRQGDYKKAAERFAKALSVSSDPKLRSDSAYNLGTSAYAQSLNAVDESTSEAAKEQLDQAQAELQRSMNHYRQALELSPDDEDAKANAELAFRRLQHIEAMKKEMQETQPQQQPQPEQQNQNQDEQQQNQQQQSDDSDDSQQDQQQDEQQNQQQSQDQQQQQQQQDNQSPQNQDQQQQSQQPNESQNQSEQQAEQPSDDQQQNPSSDDQQNPQQSGAGQQQEKEHDEMTREEAERLLQSVRDKQQERKQQQQREMSSRFPPVDKDW